MPDLGDVYGQKERKNRWGDGEIRKPGNQEFRKVNKSKDDVLNEWNADTSHGHGHGHENYPERQ